jgi:sugar/nucleoside kinase (ribokinase family)
LKKWDAVVVGELFYDDIFSGFPALPQLGEEGFARKYWKDAGGGAAITAHGLSKLGARVAVLGVVGRDGGQLIDRLNGAGIDTSLIERHAGTVTGVTTSISTHDNRILYSYYGANSGFPDLLRNKTCFDQMANAKIVHLACSIDAGYDSDLIPALKESGAIVSMDVQTHVNWLTSSDNLRLLQDTDIFFPNEAEAEWITGETGLRRILRKLRLMHVSRVAIKLGGKGAALVWDNHDYFVEAHPVAVEDTTGAGDCFDAGFLFGLLEGAPVERCLEWANICGALSTTQLGGLNGFPSLDKLKDISVRRDGSLR